MKLIANQGSELEQVIKEMWEQFVSDDNAAKEFIKECVGAMPESLSFIWAFGETGCFRCNEIVFAEGDWDRVDKKILYRIPGGRYFYVNRRTKVGRRFEGVFNVVFNHFIQHEPLEKFGIHMMIDNRYWYWQPVFDKEHGQYFIDCSNAALPYLKMKTDSQFTIVP